MTISSQTRKAGPFTGTGSTGPFPFSFKVFLASDLVVVKALTSTGAATTLALTTDYTVSLNANQNANPGGTITLTNALASTYTLAISSSIPYLQETDLTNQGGFYPEVITNALDKLTILSQQDKLNIDVSVKAPLNDAIVDMTLPSAATRANKYLSFDDQGRPISTTFDINEVKNAAASAITAASNAATSASNAATSETNAADSAATAQASEQAILTQVIASTPSIERFSGDGLTSAFTLISSPNAEENTLVFISGVYQQKDTYSVSGNVLIFSVAPPSGTDNIEIQIAPSNSLAFVDAVTTSYSPAGTGAVATTVQTKLREFVSVKDFGAKGDGVTDDIVSIQNALNSGYSVHFPKGNYYISGSVSPIAGQHISGCGTLSTIVLKDGTINGIYGNAVNNVVVKDLAFTTKTQTNATAYKAAVLVYNSTNWTISGLTISKMGYDGIRLYDSSYCKIANNRFSDFFGTVQDSADIAIMNNSSYNNITGNYCTGGSAGFCDHGIFVQDPYVGSTPTGNSITNNIIDVHLAYGIAVYVTTDYDTKHVITGNKISNISGIGSTGSGAFGSGIYLQRGGGSTVSNNVVKNCCQQTTNFASLAMASISLQTGVSASGVSYGITCSSNVVETNRGPAIWAATSTAPIVISNNIVKQNSTFSSVQAQSIYVTACSGVNILGNCITSLNATYNTIQCTAISSAFSNLQISNNIVNSPGSSLYVNGASGGYFTDVTISNNKFTGATANTGLFIANTSQAIICGNTVDSTTYALSATSLSNSRFYGNKFYTPFGSYGIIFTGTGTKNLVDESNVLQGVVENDATSGTIISMYGNAAPALSGLWRIGDRVIQSVPVVGSPKGWRCTVAGNPGTWVSEGNL